MCETWSKQLEYDGFLTLNRGFPLYLIFFFLSASDKTNLKFVLIVVSIDGNEVVNISAKIIFRYLFYFY